MDHVRVIPDPVDSERIVRRFCEHAGVEYASAFAKNDVIALLRACGYAVVPDTVREFGEKGYFSAPVGAWDASEIHCFAAALESRRRWLPTPNPIHDPKKSAARLEVERANAEGVPVFADVADRTVEDLLLMLVQQDHRQIRETVYEAVRHKLQGMEE